MTDRPSSADDLFADLDEFEGYDDVTGPDRKSTRLNFSH